MSDMRVNQNQNLTKESGACLNLLNQSNGSKTLNHNPRGRADHGSGAASTGQLVGSSSTNINRSIRPLNNPGSNSNMGNTCLSDQREEIKDVSEIGNSSGSHQRGSLNFDLNLNERMPLLPNLQNTISHQNQLYHEAPTNYNAYNPSSQLHPTFPITQLSINQTRWQQMLPSYSSFPPSPLNVSLDDSWNTLVPPFPSNVSPFSSNIPGSGSGSGFWNSVVVPFSPNGIRLGDSSIPGSRSGSGSGSRNSNVPPNDPWLSVLNIEAPHSANRNGHMTLMEEVLHSGPRFSGPNSSPTGTYISQFGHFFGELGTAHTPESFVAEMQRNHQALLEVRERWIFPF